MAVKSKKAKISAALFKDAEINIKDNIKIDPEFERLIPPLTSEELEQLEASLQQEGCREALIVWQSGDGYILVDGHNRYRLCQQHNIEFDIQVKSFANRLEVKNWMLGNQMARRNLTPLQMSYLRGIRYENEKKANGGKKEKNSTDGQNVHVPILTSEKMSKEFGVNEKTIRRDGQYALALDKLTKESDDLRWNILNGNIKAGKKTVTDLADSDAGFLQQVQEKLRETESLEKAIKLLRSEADHETESAEEEDTVKQLKKRITSLTNKAVKLDKGNPQRKEIIKELRQIFKELIQALEV